MRFFNHEDLSQDGSEEGTRQPTIYSVLVPAFLFLVFFCVALFILREPIKLGMSTWRAQVEQENLERKQKVEQEALKIQVKAKLMVIEEKLRELSDEALGVATSFEAMTGIPLEQAHSVENHEVSGLIRQSRAYATAWASMYNSRVSESDLDSHRESLSRIYVELHSGTLHPLYVAKLDEIMGWINQQLQNQKRQQVSLDQMKRESL